MSSRLVSFCCTQQTRHSVKHHSFLFLWKNRHVLDPILKQRQVLSTTQCKGLSFYFSKVTLVSSYQILTVADCSGVSTLKRFRVKRSWFKTLCHDWVYNFPMFMFWTCIFKEPQACFTIPYPGGLEGIPVLCSIFHWKHNCSDVLLTYMGPLFTFIVLGIPIYKITLRKELSDTYWPLQSVQKLLSNLNMYSLSHEHTLVCHILLYK